MDLFVPILNQMIFLFAFILIGFVLSKGKFIPDNSASVLSKLENILFVPALVMGTFITNCTPETLSSQWKVLLGGAVLVLVMILISLPLAKLCFKEKYLQKISTYGLAFANFGFMGNAIMKGIFPELFFDYLVFTLPFWFMIYVWGVPTLLIDTDEGKKGLKARAKAFVNPMFIGMLIGIVIGLSGLKLPSAVSSVIKVSGDCMSPVAMLLTGMTIAKINLLTLLKKWRIYLATGLKLLLFPLLYIGIVAFIPLHSELMRTILICGMNVACMPMGLNSIVVPAGYGKDTTDAAGMALVSHTLSVITIPLMYLLFQAVVL